MTKPGTVRKAILLVFYMAMIAIALGATYDWLVFGGRGLLIKAGGFLALFAAYLVWNDERISVPTRLMVGRVLVFVGLAVAAFMAAGVTLYDASYDVLWGHPRPTTAEIRSIISRAAMITGLLLAIILCAEKLRERG